MPGVSGPQHCHTVKQQILFPRTTIQQQKIKIRERHEIHITRERLPSLKRMLQLKTSNKVCMNKDPPLCRKYTGIYPKTKLPLPNTTRQDKDDYQPKNPTINTKAKIPNQTNPFLLKFPVKIETIVRILQCNKKYKAHIDLSVILTLTSHTQVV